MAKKNYVKVDRPNVELKAKDKELSTFVFTGQNSVGTNVEVKIDIYNWQFPEIIKRMARIAQDRVNETVRLNNEIKAAHQLV